MSQLVSILYICDSCRKIRQVDISMDKLEREGELYKIKDVHKDHEAILYLNSRYALERVMTDPPAPPLEGPIVKGLTVLDEEESLADLFEGANRIYISTKDPETIPFQVELQEQIMLNLNGKITLGVLFEGLIRDWPELTPQSLLAVINSLKIRGWIEEKGEE